MTASAPRPFPALPATVHKIHIIGVCGTAMGSLAAMLKARGYDVRGSDAAAYPPMSDWLAERDIPLMMGYAESNLDWGPDLVVVGNVSRSTYADAVATRERGIPYLSLPEALRHFFMRQTRNLVLTGTHGKTTTTSMLAWILLCAGHDPSFMVGGITGNLKTNFRLGEGEAFVIEGDEYDTAYFDKVPKFWHYAPYRATINNIEYDHADIYPDLESVEHVFRVLASMVPAEGTLWVNGDDPRAMAVSEGAQATRHTFGLGEHNTLRAVQVRPDGADTLIEVARDGEALGELRLPAFGEFNVRNVLGALAIAMDEGVSFEDARAAIATFERVKKRQEFIGEADGVLIFDDFGHHPTAVEVTLQALRAQFEGRKLWAIFEAKSNTSRRRVFQADYPRALSQADEVILARSWEKQDGLKPEELLDLGQLVADIQALGPHTQVIPEVDDIVAYVAAHARPGDVVVGMSGSAFDGLHRKLLAALQARHG